MSWGWGWGWDADAPPPGVPPPDGAAGDVLDVVQIGGIDSGESLKEGMSSPQSGHPDEAPPPAGAGQGAVPDTMALPAGSEVQDVGPLRLDTDDESPPTDQPQQSSAAGNSDVGDVVQVTGSTNPTDKAQTPVQERTSGEQGEAPAAENVWNFLLLLPAMMGFKLDDPVTPKSPAVDLDTDAPPTPADTGPPVVQIGGIDSDESLKAGMSSPQSGHPDEAAPPPVGAGQSAVPDTDTDVSPPTDQAQQSSAADVWTNIDASSSSSTVPSDGTVTAPNQDPLNYLAFLAEIGDWFTEGDVGDDYMDNEGCLPSLLRLPYLVAAGILVLGLGLGLGLGLSGGGKSPQSATPPPSTPLHVEAPAPPTYTCSGAQTTLFDNWNLELVANGGTAPTFTTNGHAYCLASVSTYHWNGGQGSGAIGTIALQRTAGPAKLGVSLPPTKAVGSAGQGGGIVNWTVSSSTSRDPVILDGSYTCVDSDPATWSSNLASNGLGFCQVYVLRATSPVRPGVTTTSSVPAGGGKSTTTTSTTTTVPSTGVASGCSGTSHPAGFSIGGDQISCSQAGQEACTPTNTSYYYVDQQFTWRGAQWQLSVTGPPLTTTTKLPVGTGAADARVTLYDNATGKSYYPASGDVTASPSGAVVFDGLVVTVVSPPSDVINGPMRC
jgi:hypothetical protein